MSLLTSRLGRRLAATAPGRLAALSWQREPALWPTRLPDGLEGKWTLLASYSTRTLVLLTICSMLVLILHSSDRIYPKNDMDVPKQRSIYEYKYGVTNAVASFRQPSPAQWLGTISRDYLYMPGLGCWPVAGESIQAFPSIARSFHARTHAER